jgi:hypothetical protein
MRSAIFEVNGKLCSGKYPNTWYLEGVSRQESLQGIKSNAVSNDQCS